MFTSFPFAPSLSYFYCYCYYYFFYLLELYCLFFHSEHEREVKRQDKFAILEVINYQAFFFFRVLALFNMVFIRKMWCNRSDCAFHDVYFLLYSPIYKLQILCYCLKSITTELSWKQSKESKINKNYQSKKLIYFMIFFSRRTHGLRK